MAGDTEIAIKVSIDPFQEVDKKKWKQMETDVKAFKKPGRVDVSGKFSVTNVKKWNKKKLEAQSRAIFRYDLSLFASQIWQAFAPIDKAKNEQDKKKLSAAFIKAIPKIQKVMVKNLNEKFEEFQEEIASGAGDDLGQLKSTRKSLTAGHPEAMMKLVNEFEEGFSSANNDLLKLKKKEQKSSGEAKEEATEELEAAIKVEVPKLHKLLAAKSAVLKKRLAVMKGVPAAIKKGLGKDLSDAAKTELKKAMDELTKAVSPVESAIAKFDKDGLDALKRIARKDIGSGPAQLVESGISKASDALNKLDDLMKKTDAKLKKLEQAAKSRK